MDEDAVSVTLSINASSFMPNVTREVHVLFYTDDGTAEGELECINYVLSKKENMYMFRNTWHVKDRMSQANPIATTNWHSLIIAKLSPVYFFYSPT